MDKAWLYIYYPLMEIKRKIFSIKLLVNLDYLFRSSYMSV